MSKIEIIFSLAFLKKPTIISHFIQSPEKVKKFRNELIHDYRAALVVNKRNVTKLLKSNCKSKFRSICGQ